VVSDCDDCAIRSGGHRIVLQLESNVSFELDDSIPLPSIRGGRAGFVDFAGLHNN
jgi:hypothetical protein